jgi:hypothetical protein
VIRAENISVNTADALGDSVTAGFCCNTYSHHQEENRRNEEMITMFLSFGAESFVSEFPL